jgi:hypothetical protein
VDIGFDDKLPTTRNKVGHKINPKMVSTRRREEPLSPNTKKARQKIVHMYADRMVEQQKDGRAQGYGKLRKMVGEARRVYPWLTEAQVKCRAKRSKSILNRRVLVDVTSPDATTTITRQGGRPKGSTNVAKKDLGTKKIQATDDIAKMNAGHETLRKRIASSNRDVQPDSERGAHNVRSC